MFKRHPQTEEVPPPDDFRFTDPSVPTRSCCCPARPAVKVTMPPTATGAHSVDLWLCGHHYRASVPALLAARASVADLTTTQDCPSADRAKIPA